MDQLVKRADQKLSFLSADEEVRRMAELREKGIADQIAREELAEERGRTLGYKEGKVETAKNLLRIGLPIEQISAVTGLPINELVKLLDQ
ncbi:hypothetical protein [Paenibacillus macerans]|uniref:hypothetical protein n=1 Tax=Paenibacillus macerans TaxID=44252 RepID=UPI00203C1870|nr:hypothetical protein [Paenibacillus macerans]MCM3700054.1 hypothetical protein [Paenibacillus macerans]